MGGQSHSGQRALPAVQDKLDCAEKGASDMLGKAGFAIVIAAVLAGCAAPPPAVRPAPAVAPPAPSVAPPLQDPEALAARFVRMAERMTPVAAAACRASPTPLRCDYQIVIDDRPGAPINAFHTLDPSGQPIVGFTLALIADARNEDELAFVFGHEVGHHIAGHIPRSRSSAMLGAALIGSLAAIAGGNAQAIRTAQNIGATVGVRSYSKAFEFEADRLGAMLAYRAGYDPERGSGFFRRFPDPGNQFLGTHPPNTERIEVVRKTVADLRAGRRI